MASAVGDAMAVCLAGPTASGKTALALELATRGRFEIISVDSAMVYRGLDIGTGKPGPEILARTPHRLVDIRDPWEAYSAGDFARDARAAIAAARAAGRVPLLVGGTMLYFRSLLRGLAPLPEADPALRARLDEEAADRGWPALHAELARVDPAAAGRIGPRDRQRIQRALEVFRLTGEPISRLQSAVTAGPGPRHVRIALLPSNRAWLHERIALRLDGMLAAGFAAEVDRLRALPGMDVDRPSMRAVGYRQMWLHQAGADGAAPVRDRILAATRQLARRQLTWLRADPADIEVPADGPDALDRIVSGLRAAGFADALSTARG